MIRKVVSCIIKTRFQGDFTDTPATMNSMIMPDTSIGVCRDAPRDTNGISYSKYFINPKT